MDGIGEGLCLIEVGSAGFTPDHVAVRGIRQATGDGRREAGFGVVKAFRRALATDELPVAFVDVARDERGAEGVGAGEDERRDADHVGCEAGGDEGPDVLLGGDQHLATHVSALLLRSQLVLEVHARGAGTQHALHELVHVEGAAEAGLAVGDDRDQPVPEHLAVVLVPLDLVGAPQGVVEPLDERRHRIDRIEALVRVHVPRRVGVPGDLPARQVQGGKPGLDVLDGLAAGHGAQGVDVLHLVEAFPQGLGAVAR